MKLSELDFTVEHRPGTKFAHVDALSRHVGAVMSGGTLSQESVLREQDKDKFCAKIKPGNYSISSEFFRDDVGLVYRRQRNDKHKLYLKSSKLPDLVQQGLGVAVDVLKMCRDDIGSQAPSIFTFTPR